jgi:ubiquinone/menaquinone biosynthesis C-methylase UbiE
VYNCVFTQSSNESIRAHFSKAGGSTLKEKRLFHKKRLKEMDTLGYGSQELFYQSFYSRVIHGNNLGARAVAQTHRKMERGVTGFFQKVLEVGGGGGGHLPYIKHDFTNYELLDFFHPPLEKVWQRDDIIVTFGNVESIPASDSSYDRVIVPCLLHHVKDPVKALEECNRVLKPGGHITIFLSCDPGITVRVLRRLTVERTSKKLGFHGHSLMQAKDHRNHVGSLLEMINFEFREYEMIRRFYPFFIPSWNLNGYIIFQGIKVDPLVSDQSFAPKIRI